MHLFYCKYTEGSPNQCSAGVVGLLLMSSVLRCGVQYAFDMSISLPPALPLASAYIYSFSDPGYYVMRCDVYSNRQMVSAVE